MLALTFGPEDAALRASTASAPFTGASTAASRTTVGRFPTGTAYSAEDPALVRWVHLTLLESLPLAMKRWSAPAQRRSRYLLRGVGLVAIQLGAREDAVPRSWRDACASIAEVYAPPATSLSATRLATSRQW